MGSRLPSRTFLPADKSGWPKHLIHRLILGRMRAGLFRVRVQGMDELRQALRENGSGVLFVANHSCWWDLFMIPLLGLRVPFDAYGMMEHANVERFGFFRRIGAYSVDRTTPSGIKASLDYTVDLLAKPGAGVWMFPQGKIECNDVRPLRFERGLSTLLKRAKRLRIGPVALRYEFWQDERPEAFVRFGPPFESDDPATVVETCRARVTELLDALKADALTQDATRFETVLGGRSSISERYARFRGRFGRGSI